jgi:hypothetical protein
MSRIKARKLVNARNLVGLANDTKWTEFFREIIRLEIPLQIKRLYETKPDKCSKVWIPAKNYFDSMYGPDLFVFIEWIKANNVEEVSRIAKIVGLEFSVENNQVTVYGYR